MTKCWLLVGGWPTPLKNMKISWCQLGWLFPIYGKINMFQTTNQYGFHLRYWWSSLIIIDPYPHASTWIFLNPHRAYKKMHVPKSHKTFYWTRVNSWIPYTLQTQFQMSVFPAFTTHAGIHYPLRQAMELVNWFVNAWFQPITCVAVKGSNPITNSSSRLYSLVAALNEPVISHCNIDRF